MRPPLFVLTNVCFDVNRGEFISIIGPSGGGKTTLLSIIGGLQTPTKGLVKIDGICPKEAQRRRILGFVFQDPSLLPWRTVLGNISLANELGVSASGKDPRDVLGIVGLEQFAEYYPHELSGGMRQKVALARAFAVDPEILLMDEPLGSLDEITRSGMRYELLRLWNISRKTVVMVTHSIPEAVILSDRVLIMSARPGQVVSELEIKLPRPRSESIERSPEFLNYTYCIREALSRATLLDLENGAVNGAVNG